MIRIQCVSAAVGLVLLFAPVGKAQPAPGRCSLPPLTDLTLLSTLTLLRYPAQDIGQKVYEFTLSQGGATYPVNAFISEDARTLFIMISLGDASQLAPGVALKMLEKNSYMGGSYFAINKKNLLSVTHTYPNQCLDSGAVKTAILETVSAVDGARDVWQTKH